MHATVRAEIPWTPSTEEERAAVLREMERLLSSRHFCNSKRYPALLEYIVRETLAGNADSLKERVLGMAVFHRPPDYDANADPIVRVTAGEIRKRIAQFYHEDGTAAEVHIDLRLGSYVPGFYPIPRSAAVVKAPPDAVPEEEALPVSEDATRLFDGPRRKIPWRISTLVFITVALLAGALLLFGFFWQARDQRSQMKVSATEFAGSGSGGRGSAFRCTAGKLTNTQRIRAQPRQRAGACGRHCDGSPYQRTRCASSPLSDHCRQLYFFIGSPQGPHDHGGRIQ